MSLREQNHTSETHRQLDDELQRSFLHNKVKLALLWQRRDILFAILCDSGDLFLYSKRDTVFPFTLCYRKLC